LHSPLAIPLRIDVTTLCECTLMGELHALCRLDNFITIHSVQKLDTRLLKLLSSHYLLVTVIYELNQHFNH